MVIAMRSKKKKLTSEKALDEALEQAEDKLRRNGQRRKLKGVHLLAYKLKGVWTIETQQDLVSMFGLDVQKEMEDIIS